MSLPAQLTPAEYGRLAGLSTRAVQYRIARNEMPPGSVIRIGTSKHAKHARLLTAKLLAAGYLVPETAQVSP